MTRFKNILLVIKQTAFESYSQLKLRGQAPKALRWKRLESRYNAHKSCVTDLIDILKSEDVSFKCVNRVDLDRQHLHDIDLLISVGGDGTVLSSSHFLDAGTIPLCGINSDPTTPSETDVEKKQDERRSHGALCMFGSNSLKSGVHSLLHSDLKPQSRNRISITVKSAFSETHLVPCLNDILVAHPTPASVSRFRMGWLQRIRDSAPLTDGKVRKRLYGDTTRVGGEIFEVKKSFNAWSSGMWVSTSTGSSAAMSAAGGTRMKWDSPQLQYLIREHLIEKGESQDIIDRSAGMLNPRSKLHLRWNSLEGRIYLDGSHLFHELELGDEIIISGGAPPLRLFMENENET
mmetsp:Transcript_23023/g.43275  ORF Transcript_23023/g.43275 Transcript_23023/m.43275 type:complete len:347 (-) Transcript_23023:40-1080(-)|eukprot:CAMPEP_0182513822 /NCGR_PEP_ID=MMETSP1321-20130603/34668_1 /TAXON_ID=91990 /ORGANISM="Bolidomonas sp., Strain RCC1657" /LENGTH=346 /DNA_ID=CAMNT_0024720897 /DNA_START=219 /DNA_END=1259 /DNA_ORIENTATION=+